MKKHHPITLKAWIERQGVACVARQLNVTRQTVNNWKRGYCTPRSDQAIRLHHLAKGELGYATILESKRSSP